MPDPKVYDQILDESLGPRDPSQASSQEGLYDSIFADEDRRKEAALRQASEHAADQPADRALQVQKISKRLGLPVDVVERNYEAMAKRARSADTDFSRMMRESPIVSSWLTEENNAKLAQDELPQLGALERSLRFGRRAVGAFGAGVMGASRGFWGLVQAGAEAAPDGLGMVPREGWKDLAGFAAATAGDVSTMQTGMRGDTFGASGLETGVLSGVESLGQSASMIPLLFVPGGQGVAAATFAGGMGATAGGQAYADAREAGIAPNQALVYAYGQGGVEVVTEMIPAKWLLGDLAKNAGLTRMLMHQIASELPGEQVATVFQDLNEWAVLHPDKPFSSYLEERPSAAAQTLIATIVAVGGHTTAVRVLDRAVNGGKTPTQRTLEEAGAALAAAGTTASSPEKIQELVGRMAPPGSKLETVYLPVETFVSYFQDRQVNPATIAEALTGSKTALAEAVALGTELSVPTARYLEVIGKTEHNAYFAREARFDPDELNAREEDAAIATEGGKALAADLAPADAEAPNVEAIRSSVRDQLIEAGMDKRAADQYAGLHANAFATLGTRAGIDPQVLFDRYRLAITRETGAQTGAAGSANKARTVSTLDLARAIEQTRARRGESTTDQPILGDVGAPPGQEVPEGTGESQTTGAELAGGVEPVGGPAQPGPGGGPLESVPASRGSADIPGLPAPGGVPRSVPRPGESTGGRLRRRSKHYSALVRSLLTAARKVDPIANLAAVRRELTFRIEAFEERQGAYLESGQDPLDLLREIAALGGLNTVDKSYPGELRWLQHGLRFGSVAGVPGVFKRDGLSVDDMVTSLNRQEQRFEWVTDIDVLIDAIDDAVRHPVNQEEDRFPGTEDLKDDLKIDPETAWWKSPWMAEGAPEPALGLDEDLLGDAVELEGGDLSFDPADLEGTPFEELNQGPAGGPMMMTMEEVLGADIPELEVEGRAELPDEATGRQAAPRDVNPVARVQALAPRPDVSPDSRAVPFEAIPDAYGTTLFRARDVATTYQARLPIDRLIATQATVSEREVLRKLEEPVAKVIDVLEYEGRYYIADGTHTSTAAWARGDKLVTARVTKVRADWLEAPPPYRSALEPVPPAPIAVVVAQPEELYQPGNVEDYGGQHRPPGPEDGAPASDLTGEGRIYPDDVYSGQGAQFYGMGGDYRTLDQETFRLLHKLKGKPNAKVTVYRSVPANLADAQINPGDWVTVNRGYAERHGLRFEDDPEAGGGARILSRVVTAGEIFTNGDSIHEWGYWPAASQAEGAAPAVQVTPGDSPVPIPETLTQATLEAWVDQVAKELGLAIFDVRLGQRLAGNLILEAIAVKKADAGAGKGTRAMRALTALADQHGKTIELSLARPGYQPARGSVKTTGRARLVEYYKRFGFVENKGRRHDPALSLYTSMYREPGVDRLTQPDRRGGERGVIRIGADRSMSIALFASADLSTFLHESGHFFLEVFHDTAQALGNLDPTTLSPEQKKLLADYGKALEWMGVENWADVQVDQKEQWARGFEAYLFEGKAPSPELRSMFGRFAAWLRGIYRSLRALKVELTPEVRGVFDRLLATDAAITAAQAEARLGPLFLTQESAGMTPEEWEAYQGGIAKAREAAETKLRVELLADYARARETWWKEERARVRAEVATQRGQDQVYVAMAAIRTGLRPDGTPFIPGAPVAPLKLNKRDLEKLVPGATKKLPRPFLYTTEGGIHPDDAAELLAYDNGQALVEAMILSDPFDKVVDQQTDQIMAERYGDRLAGGQLEALAKDAVESNDQAELLEAEQRALARKRREVAPFVQAEAAKGERALDELEREREYERRWFEAEARLRLAIERGAKQAEIDELRRRAEVDKAALRQGARAVAASVPSVKALRAIAQARVSQTKVGDLKPQTFWNAARKAGTQAIDAAARQDWDKAVEAKGRQRLNLELYRATQDAVDQVEEAREEAKAVFRADATLAKSRNMDYVAAARILAARYFFPTRQESAIEAIERLRTYDPDLYANLEAQIAGALAGAGDLKDLTVENFIGVKDTIAALWAQSRRDKQVEIEGKLLEREAVQGELVARLQAVGLPTDKPGYSQAATKWEQTRMYLMGARSALRRVEHWVDAVDQGNPAGPFRRFFWQPISEAAARYRQAKVGVLQTYLEIVKGVEASITPGQIAAPEIGYTFSGRAELLHALLHTGNASNLQKLLRGRKWGEFTGEGDAQVLDTSRWDKFVERAQREGILTRADYVYAQATWDLLETLKAPAQQAHRQMYGTYFSEIVAVPLSTPFGTFRGGYVPAIADPFLAPDAATKGEKASLTEGQNSFMFPTTGRGFTKARTEAYAKPLALNLALIPQHVDKVLRFIHLEPVVKDVARMVFDPTLRATLDAFDPTVGGDLLVPWLQRSASQRIQTPSQGWGGRAADTFFRGVRTRVGLNIMAANVVNTLQQFTGFSLSATKVKKRYLVRALWRFVRNPRQFAEEAARDPWMATRVSSSVMEVQSTIDDLLLNPSKYDQARAFAQRHGYFAQAMTQNVVDLMTYGAAYEEAVEEDGADELEARRRAGAAVRMTQGSFAPEDVSRFETGSPFMRAFSMFFSYFNNQANLLGSGFATIVRDDVGLRKGAGRALYLYSFGFMIPAVLSEIIRQGVVGFEDDDDESYLDEVLALFFGSQFRGATAFVPILGPTLQATINAFNDKGWDDRITTSPAVSTLEQSARAPKEVYDAIVEGRGYKKAIRDTLTLVGLMTGLPVAPLGRPLGYAADVAEGNANPSGPLELTQGLVSGRAPR